MSIKVYNKVNFFEEARNLRKGYCLYYDTRSKNYFVDKKIGILEYLLFYLKMIKFSEHVKKVPEENIQYIVNQLSKKDAEKFIKGLLKLQNYIYRNPSEFKTQKLRSSILSKINFVLIKKHFKVKNSKKEILLFKRKIGTGTSATVYEVQNAWSGKIEALKIGFANKYGTEEQEKELNLLRKIHSEGLHPYPFITPTGVQITLFNKNKAKIAMLQPLADGDLLHAPINFDPFQTTKELSLALHHLHKMGISHNDVKPENIFVKNGHIQLADFDASTEIDRGAPQNFETFSELFFLIDVMNAANIFFFTAGDREQMIESAGEYVEDLAQLYAENLFSLSIKQPTKIQEIIIQKIIDVFYVTKHRAKKIIKTKDFKIKNQEIQNLKK